MAIIENPFYAVMNEPNSTVQRLIRKLNLMDVVDDQLGSGKLDLIIQLPYIVRSEARKKQAEDRRAEIERQLAGSTATSPSPCFTGSSPTPAAASWWSRPPTACR